MWDLGLANNVGEGTYLTRDLYWQGAQFYFISNECYCIFLVLTSINADIIWQIWHNCYSEIRSSFFVLEIRQPSKLVNTLERQIIGSGGYNNWEIKGIENFISAGGMLICREVGKICSKKMNARFGCNFCIMGLKSKVNSESIAFSFQRRSFTSF